MTKQQNKTLLMWTLIVIAVLQMPQLAILPATNLIATEVFPEYPIQTIHTVMSSPGVVSVICSIIAGALIRYGLASKKGMTVLGLALVMISGVTAIFLNTQLWQLLLMNILIGAGIGVFVPSSQSIMFDSFDEKTRHFMTGVQFSFINGGGLVLSLLCGVMINIVWYGGQALMLVAIPFMIFAYIVIPKDKRTKAIPGGNAVRTKIPPRVYYYSFVIFIYIVLYSVAVINISTHIEQGSIGDPSTAGVATALMMGGAVVSGYLLPKVTQRLHDHVFSVALVIMTVAFSLMNLFPTSLMVTLVAMFIFGLSMSLIVPNCIFQASRLSDPTNSATITVIVCSVSAGVGNTVSPLIITNLTLALGGESTRFRFQFTAFLCLAFAVLFLIFNLYSEKRLAKTEAA